MAYTTNLISAPVSLDVDWWCPNALLLDTTNITPAYLEYYVLDANFVQNISYSAPATILLYYSPDWQSVSLGGTGSGQNAILLAGGDWSPGSPNGLFRIYADPAGSNLYFGGVTNGVVSNYVTVPIAWSSNSWHQVGIEWGVAGRHDSSAIYLDGALAATGTVVSIVPQLGTDTNGFYTNGFYVGSDSAGFEQCRGAIWNFVTFDVRYGAYYTNSWAGLSNALAAWQASPGGGFGALCVFRRLSDTDSNFCRTAFRFQPDTVPIHVGQCSGLMSDSFRAPLEWCPTGLERCPGWPGMVSDRNRNRGPEGVERRWNGCQGSRSIQVNRERHLMAQNKLTMRQIQEILRLKHQNQLSVREIARSCGLPASTVGDYLKRAAAAGLSWPLPEGQSEAELLQRLLATPPAARRQNEPVLPDWPHIHQELARKSVTLQLLWQEYRQTQPEGYGYSRFCELYRAWAGTLDPVLRQIHLPGEKMFVDWAGQKVEIHNAQDGSVSSAHLFVAVLGASNKTFAEAFENEQLAAWIEAHCHAYAFFQGVARITVPDNLKTGVIRPCRYEPLLHRSYQEMAEHYGTVIIPGRIKKPRDKAKVEGAVLIAERQILAALRDQRFFHVGQLNAAIRPLLAQLNEQPFQKLEGSRNSWFETLEKSRLLPLPATAFELADWSTATVNIDYHVAVDKHFYSAPYQLIHQQLDVRLTDKTVELFQHGKRVAAHRRSHQPGRFTTVEEHRPKSHQRYLQWTPSRILEWVKTIGPECVKVVEKIMADRPHPEQGFRSALGIIRLGKAVGHERLEAACRRALHFGTCSYTSLNSILQNNLESRPLEQELPLPSPAHENLRGGPYYS